MASFESRLPRLAAAVKKWMEGEGWEDEVEVAEDANSSRIVTDYSINDQIYKLFIETDEEASHVIVYFYSPYKVPPARMPEMARLLNIVNIGLSVGRLACSDDEDSNPVQFLWKIPVRDSTLTSEQLGALVYSGAQVFEVYGSLLAQCVFSNRNAVELSADFQKERKAAGLD